MIAESLSRRYALALFSLSKKRNELENVFEEFQTLVDLMQANENFRYFLNSPKIDTGEKKQVLQSIFGKIFSRSLFYFLYLLLDKKRQTIINKIHNQFVILYNNNFKRATITIRPASTLDEKSKQQVRKVFEKKLDRSVTLIEEVDPRLIGGLQVRVHNTIYDASVRGKLNNIRKALVAG